MNIIELSPSYSVAPQIALHDIAELKALGFDVVVNNRPDAEEEHQPTSLEVQQAVEALGMKYVFNPVDLKALSEKEVVLQSAVLNEGDKVFAYCRTGTRSSVLWVLANQSVECSFDSLITHVTGKGFDLGRCLPAMLPLKR